MAKQIIWSKLAQMDRFRILDYWTQRNQSAVYSRKLNRIFEETIVPIGKYPKLGKATDMPGVRIKIVLYYFITYRETTDFIEILTIWDSRQDPVNFDKIIKE